MSLWTTAKIGDLCRTGTGGTPSRSKADRYYGGHIPWVKSGELRETTITETEECVTDAALAETSLKLVPAGALLLAMYGATVGRLGILGVPATTNQAVCHLIPDPAVLEPRYLYRALENQVPHIVSRGVGGAQPNISQGIVKEIPVPLPPLSEQRRIADILDQADALRAKRRAALAQLDTLTQAIFLEMFGDPATNPKGWKRVPLGELTVRGPQNGLYKPASEYGTGVRILRIDGFYDGRVVEQSSMKRLKATSAEQDLYGLAKGDIVINRVNSREYLGKSAIILRLEEPMLFESNMMRFSVDEQRADPGYVVQFLQTSFIKSQIRVASKDAVNQSSINQQDVKAFEINVPDLRLQREFVRRRAQVDALAAAHRTSLTKLDELFASLQHRAFRGEL